MSAPLIPFVIAIPKVPLLHFPPQNEYDHQHVRQLSELEYEAIIETPFQVPEFYVALEGRIPSDDYGVGIYWLQDDGNYEFLHGVTNCVPTQSIMTGWHANPDMQSKPVARIGLRIESREEIITKCTRPRVDYNIAVAGKTAQNLVDFLQSFQGLTSEMNRAVEAWLKRFTEKIQRDPLFIMRTN
eukprot:GHVH01017375.1.p1 GENE.GHVH01017375.1~~GHVH01017375.1.p1  ORF type:complete len:207 (+),score=11.00 GHVH01017375.1:68-622(+)